MILTAKQEEAIKIAVSRYRARKPWTCIAGYAGVGKSTVVKYIISALNLPPDYVAYIAFTGKAATVLRHKGCPNAMTAHKFLYYSSKNKDGSFTFKPKPKTRIGPYKLVVVDEISMLPKKLWDLLLSYHIPVIACGDPFQLPPISKNTDNHVLDFPHIFLDQIMRQAQESEIIRLTMDIREGKKINYQKGNEVQILPYQEVIPGMYNWADQIICATNKMRIEINDTMRQWQGRGKIPEPGDKVIACRNCWEILEEKGENALVNGTIGYLQNIDFHMHEYPIRNFPLVPVMDCDIVTDENEIYHDLMVDRKTIEEGEKFLTSEQEYEIYHNSELKGTEPLELEYGYAITCHRAQGSEWNNIMVIEERFPFSREEHARWLYTACTRASSKLVLVR